MKTQKTVPVWIYVVFQQNTRQYDQNSNNDNSYRMPVTSCQVIIGTEKNPDSAILLNYNDDDYGQGYGQIEEAFRAQTKDNLLQPYISEDDFRSSNDGDNIGYNIHAFGIRYQKNFERAHLMNVVFKFSENILPGIYGCALVLTNCMASNRSDCQRMFDLF